MAPSTGNGREMRPITKMSRDIHYCPAITVQEASWEIMTLDPCPKCGKRIGDKHKVPFVEAYQCGRTIHNTKVREEKKKRKPKAIKVKKPLVFKDGYVPRKKRAVPPPSPPPEIQRDNTTELELDIFSCIDLDLTALLTPPYYPIEP